MSSDPGHLQWAIKNGDLATVRKTVETSGTNVNEQIDGRSPLHYAADYGQLELIEYLVEKGAEVNALDKHKISPLLAAIWEGHVDCVKYLLNNGADRSGRTPDGKTYLEAAESEDIRNLLAN